MKFVLTRKTNTVPDVRSLRSSMDRLFDDFFNLSTVDFFDSEWLPAIDIINDEKNMYIKADVAGIDEKDINVTVQDNILTISGERTEEQNESKNSTFTLLERKKGSFSRSILLPDGVKAENVKAELKNGVLTITLPKGKPVETKKIKIGVK